MTTGESGPADPGTEASGPSGARRSRRLVAAALLGAVAVLAAAVAVGVVVARDDGDSQAKGPGLEVVSDRDEVTHSFVVPAGTAMRLQQGLHVDVVPDRLEVRVGDTIRIRNEDNEEAEVGVFSVAPGVTVTMRFTEPGRLEGYCSVDPSGRFVIDVLE